MFFGSFSQWFCVDMNICNIMLFLHFLFHLICNFMALKNIDKRINLNIVYSTSTTDFNSPVLAHFRIGNNIDPISKIDAFVDLMNNGIGNKVDIAFFKFCYIDITGNTNIQNIFNIYKEHMLKLKQRYPETTLIHVTVPLTVMKAGFNTWIKKLLSKKYIWEYDDSIQRNKFNHLLREEYRVYDPIFDLAKIESTFPNGKTCSFIRNGTVYQSLVPAYTTDGGHLNELGGKVVARHLLIFLANLSSR